MGRRRNSGQRQRQLVYGGRRPRAKRNIVAKVPKHLANLTGWHMSFEERRQRLPLPSWAAPASAFRPTTQEYSQAAENIALINYCAFKRAKKTTIKNENSWQHYMGTQPRGSRKLIAYTRASKLDPVPHESGLEFRESWLEPVPDEYKLDAEFEEQIKYDGPKVRLLKRVLRQKQKNHDALSKKYKTRISGFKPQRWIPRSDPKIKLPKMNDWLERHNLRTVADAVKKENKEAIMGQRGTKIAGKGEHYINMRRHHRGGDICDWYTEKQNRRSYKNGRHWRSSQYFAKRPNHFKPHPGDPTTDGIAGRMNIPEKSPLLSRSTSLTVVHQKKWYGHNQDWQGQRASVNSLPPLLPALTHAATISGGVRYISPLLLPHEQDSGRLSCCRSGWQR